MAVLSLLLNASTPIARTLILPKSNSLGKRSQLKIAVGENFASVWWNESSTRAFDISSRNIINTNQPFRSFNSTTIFGSTPTNLLLENRPSYMICTENVPGQPLDWFQQHVHRWLVFAFVSVVPTLSVSAFNVMLLVGLSRHARTLRKFTPVLRLESRSSLTSRVSFSESESAGATGCDWMRQGPKTLMETRSTRGKKSLGMGSGRNTRNQSSGACRRRSQQQQQGMPEYKTPASKTEDSVGTHETTNSLSHRHLSRINFAPYSQLQPLMETSVSNTFEMESGAPISQPHSDPVRCQVSTVRVSFRNHNEETANCVRQSLNFNSICTQKEETELHSPKIEKILTDPPDVEQTSIDLKESTDANGLEISNYSTKLAAEAEALNSSFEEESVHKNEEAIQLMENVTPNNAAASLPISNLLQTASSSPLSLPNSRIHSPSSAPARFSSQSLNITPARHRQSLNQKGNERLRSAKVTRCKSMPATSGRTNNIINRTPSTISSESKQQRDKTTYVLTLGVTLLFLALYTPVLLLRPLEHLFSNRELYRLLQTVFSMFQHTFHCSDFYLYVSISKAYRRKLVRAVRTLRKSLRV